MKYVKIKEEKKKIKKIQGKLNQTKIKKLREIKYYDKRQSIMERIGSLI